ncbi:MAG: hypothetical protein HY077_16625 [Elusimicrobia bacterium]|nr:hypothetical protein [Elusimicrobiota bacterium]
MKITIPRILCVLLLASSRGLAAPTEGGPSADFLAAAGDYVDSLKAVDGALDRGDRKALGDRAGALRTAVRRLRDASTAPLEAQRASAPCLRRVEAFAWSLGELAQSPTAPADELRARFEQVEAAGDECDLVTLGARVASRGDLDWALARADAKLKTLETSSRRAAGCEKTFSVEGLVRDLSGGRFSPVEMEAMNETLGPKVVHYYQHKAFEVGDPAVCDGLGGVEQLFIKQTEVQARCGGWQCRQWYNDKEFTMALTKRGPDLEEVCRRTLPQEYSWLPKAEAESACAIIARNIDDPKKLCSELSPRYLGPGKIESCVSEFDRYRVYTDQRACGYMEGWPGSWLERCKDLAAYTRASHAKDPALCGDRELCWVYMGAWRGRYAGKYVTEIRDSYCGLERRNASLERKVVGSLLDKASAYAARGGDATGSPADDRIRAEKLSRLKDRYARFQDYQTSAPPAEATSPTPEAKL